ncbi:MAG: hypothetical protein KDA32_03970 [Phycisphaerales bacterium]|nr:hypothetical protein [Phycisphaerales bacterium]
MLRKLALIATLAGSAAAFGQYEINWFTIDGGGGTSAGGVYTVSGTIGQPDAGIMGGGNYTLSGGFWVGVGEDCPADLTGDGVIGLADLAQLIAAFGTSLGDPNYDPGADITGDDAVGLSDLALLLSVFGTSCP